MEAVSDAGLSLCVDAGRQCRDSQQRWHGWRLPARPGHTHTLILRRLVGHPPWRPCACERGKRGRKKKKGQTERVRRWRRTAACRMSSSLRRLPRQLSSYCSGTLAALHPPFSIHPTRFPSSLSRSRPTPRSPPHYPTPLLLLARAATQVLGLPSVTSHVTCQPTWTAWRAWNLQSGSWQRQLLAGRCQRWLSPLAGQDLPDSEGRTALLE